MSFLSRVEAAISERHQTAIYLVVDKTLDHVAAMRKILGDIKKDSSINSFLTLYREAAATAKSLITWCANAPAPVRAVMLKIRTPLLLPYDGNLIGSDRPLAFTS